MDSERNYLQVDVTPPNRIKRIACTVSAQDNPEGGKMEMHVSGLSTFIHIYITSRVGK